MEARRTAQMELEIQSGKQCKGGKDLKFYLDTQKRKNLKHGHD